MQTIIIVLLGAFALLSISLERTYHRVPAKELKRRARSGDEMANMLYRAVSYGPSLGVVLWLLIGISNATFFVVLTKTSPTWFAAVGIIAVIWIGFLWLPARDVTKAGSWVATRLAPAFGWILRYVHPLVSRAGHFMDRHRVKFFHHKLYEKEDLLDLINKQKVDPDNRINQDELDMAGHVLTFGDKKVRDFLTPRRVVRSVSVEESVGPILMGELHKSGHSRFPVYDGKKNNMVGILYLRDLINTEEKTSVKQLLRKDVFYIHEDQSLYEVLQASIKVRQHLFIVVNSFEEYVGVISVEDVLEQALGQKIVDEFDQYDDLREVAASQAEKEHKEHDEVV